MAFTLDSDRFRNLYEAEMMCRQRDEDMRNRALREEVMNRVAAECWVGAGQQRRVQESVRAHEGNAAVHTQSPDLRVLLCQ